MELWIKKIESASTLEELESLRVDTLGKKGVLTIEFAKMKDIPAVDKKSFAEDILGDGSTALNGFVPSNFAKDPSTGEDFRKENVKMK